MTGVISTFDSTKQSLNLVLSGAESGKTQLPDFQRGWVWDDDHIKDLLASVSRGFPIGTVMLLETGGDGVQFKPRPIEGAEPRVSEPEQLVLDGQQRITSLFQSLLSGNPVRTRDSRGKEIDRWYYINIPAALDDDVEREDAIVSIPADKVVRTNFGRDVELDLSTEAQEYQELMFPLTQAFSSLDWRTGFQEHWDFDREKIRLWNRFETEVVQAFQAFQLPVIELKKETPKEAVCLVFEKVNTGGVSLTVFELLTATFAASNFDLREDWRHRQAALRERQVLRAVESTDFLQAVTLLHTYDRRHGEHTGEQGSMVSCKRRDMLRLEAEDYRKWADQVQEGFDRAARFLHNQHVLDVKFLPYATQLVPLAALLTLLGSRADDHHVKEKLTRWYWCGVFGELYGSATETRFARDLVDVLEWIDGGPEPRTIADANFAPERLLTMRTRNSAAYRGLYVLLLREGARDFRTSEPSNIQTYFDENVDIHHLFPKKWCQDREIEAGVYDSIVNKTPLTSKTNRIIGGNAPSQYLGSLERNHGIPPETLDENLRSHLITPGMMRGDDFEAFYRDRSGQLLDAIARVMGKRPQDEHDGAWLPDLTYIDVEAETEMQPSSSDSDEEPI